MENYSYVLLLGLAVIVGGLQFYYKIQARPKDE